ncbi:MAG: hypothetical protein ACLPWO_05350 [Thermoplasmata archaeon]
MQAPTTARRRRAFWVYIGVGVAVAAVVVLGIGPPGILLPRSTVCQLGSLVGSYVIWTPNEPVNKPEGANVSAFVIAAGWNYTFTSGSLTVGGIHPNPESGNGWGDDSPDAGIALQGTLNNWTFYRVTNASVTGGGSNPCTQPYVAELGLPPYPSCGGPVTIPLEDNSSDVLEPHVWNGLWGPNDSFSEPPSCPGATPGTQVWFDTSFHSGGTGNSAPAMLSLCGMVGTFPVELDGIAQVPVVVTVPYAGHEISAAGYETWQGQPNPGQPFPGMDSFATAYYQLPDGWNWTLAPVGPADFPIDTSVPLPALVAFVRSNC